MTKDELDVAEGLQEWSKEYDHYINNPPKEGDILKTLDPDSKVLLVVELVEKSPPFVYGRVYVPDVVGSQLGWYLRGSEDGSFHGWKCILLPIARTELIRKFGLQNETMEVKSLRMVRMSQSKKSLLCEVHDYGIEEEVVETDVADTPAVEAEVDVAEVEVAVAEAAVTEDQAVTPEVSL